MSKKPRIVLLHGTPVAVEPIQRAFEAIPRDLAEAAAVSGMAHRPRRRLKTARVM